MSGRELDPDGTDSYHPQHPWEQSGHPLYLSPQQRTLDNWPPEAALPAGPTEAAEWRSLPESAGAAPAPGEWHNRDNCGPECTGMREVMVNKRYPALTPCRCVCHRPRIG